MITLFIFTRLFSQPRGRAKRGRGGSEMRFPAAPATGNELEYPAAAAAPLFPKKGSRGIRLRRFAPPLYKIAPQSGASFFDPLSGKGGRGIRAPISLPLGGGGAKRRKGRPRRADNKKLRRSRIHFRPLLVGGGQGGSERGLTDRSPKTGGHPRPAPIPPPSPQWPALGSPCPCFWRNSPSAWCRRACRRRRR